MQFLTLFQYPVMGDKENRYVSPKTTNFTSHNKSPITNHSKSMLDPFCLYLNFFKAVLSDNLICKCTSDNNWTNWINVQEIAPCGTNLSIDNLKVL